MVRGVHVHWYVHVQFQVQYRSRSRYMVLVQVHICFQCFIALFMIWQNILCLDLCLLWRVHVHWHLVGDKIKDQSFSLLVKQIQLQVSLAYLWKQIIRRSNKNMRDSSLFDKFGNIKVYDSSFRIRGALGEKIIHSILPPQQVCFTNTFKLIFCDKSHICGP